MIDVDEFKDHNTMSCHKDNRQKIDELVEFYSKHYETIAIHKHIAIDNYICLHACGVKK